MATAKTLPGDWIRAGLSALTEGGPDAVRVEQLAARLGVTKGGFYWHFRGRQDFLSAMLDAWEHTVVEAVISEVEQDGGTPRERLQQLFGLARVSFTTAEGLGAELAIREWSRRDPTVAARVRRIDERRMSYLRELFGELCGDEEEAEARCLQVYSLFVAGHLITTGHGDLTREQVLARSLGRLVE